MAPRPSEDGWAAGIGRIAVAWQVGVVAIDGERRACGDVCECAYAEAGGVTCEHHVGARAVCGRADQAPREGPVGVAQHCPRVCHPVQGVEVFVPLDVHAHVHALHEPPTVGGLARVEQGVSVLQLLAREEVHALPVKDGQLRVADEVRARHRSARVVDARLRVVLRDCWQPTRAPARAIERRSRV